MSDQFAGVIVAFVLAFLAGYVAVRSVSLIGQLIRSIKAERDRKARLNYFKRRWPVD
jgi:hypothetical protein